MDNNNMNTIKYLKEERIELNGVIYKPYKICNLPPSFGMYEEFESEDGTVYKYPIISEWFNHKGYTYIAEQNMSPWEIVKQIAGHIYTDEQIDEMTWAECAEIIAQKE